MVTNQDNISFSKKLGISLIVITTAERLRNLPTGNDLDVTNLLGILEILPSTRSVIIVAYKTWDLIFNAAENQESPLVAEDVKELERKLIKRPTLNSLIECTICQDVCIAHLKT